MQPSHGGRLAAACVLAMAAGEATADPAFTMTLEDMPSNANPAYAFNHVLFTITNEASEARLVAFDWELSPPGLFDGPVPKDDPRSQFSPPPGGEAILLDPDFNQAGGRRAAVLRLTFEGFDPGETFRLDVDIDTVTADNIADARRLIFGTSRGSFVEARFSDGTIVRGALPYDPTQDFYRFVFP